MTSTRSLIRTAGAASPASLALREVALARPQDVAVKVDEFCVSYAELNAQADQLAQRLVREGSPGDRVGLRANSTHAIAVGCVAIQRAGMVLVQVDPTAPPDWVRTILADVEAEVLLSDVEGDEELAALVGDPLTFGAGVEPHPVQRERGELVSIVFTSGSTGAPKGIMQGREQLADMLVRRPKAPGLGRALDDAGIDLQGARLGALVAGTVGPVERLLDIALYGQATLVSYEIRRHGIVPLGPWLVRERIAFVSMVPTVLRALLATLRPGQTFADLRLVVLGGETTNWEDVIQLRRHLSPEATIINALVATEAGGIARLHITADTPTGTGPLPAGELYAESNVTIVDEDGAPVPPGRVGEIVVEGRDCALGYWRRPDLTASRFAVLPSGHRRVRTGDGGRISPDGRLEHLGRLDSLVKVSGNRVELDELEKELALLGGVAAAAAAPYTDETQDMRLTACVVPAPGAALDARLLRASLARRLPGYMIPDHIAIVNAIPRLPSGKADRPAVAELRGTDRGGAAGQPVPEGSLERQLIEVWSEVLGASTIGLHDDFFELGGDSIRAARMFVELERRYGIDRPVSLLAEAPTVAALALALSDDSAWGAILAVQTNGARPPLIVVHDGSGSVLYARGLVDTLGPDQPVYSIRCQELDGSPLRARSIEELAATYIERVRALYPHGPYVFYGASLGGIVGMEMASQLIRDGEEVPLAILGDSTAPDDDFRGNLPFDTRAARRLGEIRTMSIRAAAHHSVWLMERQINYLRRRLTRDARIARRLERMLSDALERGAPIPLEARGRHVLREYGALLHGYRVHPPVPERVLLVRTGDKAGLPDRGWGPLVGEGLEIVDVPGTHNDLGREASGRYVGPLIAQALERLPVAVP